jgi:CheY-like chemotaxis protein
MSKRIDFILLIDDDEATNFYHRIMAEESGVTDTILEADTVDRALELLRSRFADAGEVSLKGLVFLDINLPAKDGWCFIEAVERFSEPWQKQLSIVMLSASEVPRELDRINAHPLIHSFIPKPLSPEKIHRILEG